MESSIFINFNNSGDKNSELIAELLTQYQDVICSSIGAVNGRTKFIAGAANTENLIVTNSACHLFKCLYKSEHFQVDKRTTRDNHELGFIRWQFDMIKSVIQTAHFNHFYDSGLFLCHLINEFLIYFNKEGSNTERENLLDKHGLDFRFNKSVTDFLFKSLIENLAENKQNVNLNSSLVALKLNLNNLSFLRKFVKSILNSKCLVDQLDLKSNDSFVNLCLRAFIKSFHSDETNNSVHFSPIIYLFNEDLSFHLDKSELHDGVLFKLDKFQIEDEFVFESSLAKKKDFKRLKCVIFDTNAFSGDFELMENVEFKLKIEAVKNQPNIKFILLNNLKKICDLLTEKFQIDVLLCQKVMFNPRVFFTFDFLELFFFYKRLFILRLKVTFKKKEL
jgi:hypothetical protein